MIWNTVGPSTRMILLIFCLHRIGFSIFQLSPKIRFLVYVKVKRHEICRAELIKNLYRRDKQQRDNKRNIFETLNAVHSIAEMRWAKIVSL